MALLVRGVSRCPICGEVIAASDSVTAFPPFVSNELDPLFPFSDAAFHDACVHQHPDGSLAHARAAEMRERLSPEQRRCAACGQPITDPDDYLGFGYLTEAANSSASAFNYVQLHRSHVSTWRELDGALFALEELQESGKWRGDALSRLIATLREFQRLARM